MSNSRDDGGAGNGPTGPAGSGPGGSGNDPIRPTQPPRPNLQAEPHPATTPRFSRSELPLTDSGPRYETTHPGYWKTRRHHNGL